MTFQAKKRFAVSRNLQAGLFLFVLLFSSYSTVFAVANTMPGEEHWLLAVYMSADNDLSENAELDLEDLLEANIPSYMTVTVLVDQNKTGDSRAFTIGEGGNLEVPLSDVNPAWGSELDMSDPTVLSSFVVWSMDVVVPDRIFLAIWGHGQGWKGSAMDRGRWLTLAGIDEALGSARQATGGGRLDILGFDQCNMAMASVGFELKEHTDFFIFSEKEEDARGWPYGRFMDALPQSSPTPVSLGEILIHEFISWSTTSSRYSATLSMASSQGLDALALDVAVFVDAILPALSIYSAEAHDAVYGAQRYGAIPEPVDLHDTFHRLSATMPSQHIRGLAAAAAEAVLVAVVVEGSYDNPRDEVRVDRARGLGVYAPPEYVEAAYAELGWAQQTSWHRFIDAVNTPPAETESAWLFVEPGPENVYAVLVPAPEQTIFVVSNPVNTTTLVSADGETYFRADIRGLWHVEAVVVAGDVWIMHTEQAFWHGPRLSICIASAAYVSGNGTILTTILSSLESEAEVNITMGTISGSADIALRVAPGVSKHWVTLPAWLGEGVVLLSLDSTGQEGQCAPVSVNIPDRPGREDGSLLVKGRINIGGTAYSGPVSIAWLMEDGNTRNIGSTQAVQGSYSFNISMPPGASVFVISAAGVERTVEAHDGGLLVVDLDVYEEQTPGIPVFVPALFIITAFICCLLAYRRSHRREEVEGTCSAWA